MRWGVGGFRPWMVQRLSAIYLALFLLLVLLPLLISPPADFAAWRAQVGAQPLWMGWALFFVSLLLHAWVGVRDVVLDYVHPLALRFSVLALFGLSLLALAVWVLRVLFAAGVP